ncbi:hypothetical protein D7X94_06095 [Acutalibacter sp. 1XD8-33]|uniref:hypothetical protein n=1 Tax=Acutalibacter sp. 1XD8-33 TaxID=2320081 RepID=UPI000EA174F4|nr:hypothetical protein [Acutalibacter sp. 1XD8-33]RKJ40970.1 hypothetical protein D7X94_06095 [Acutalibacter sp. 1XD8-33]
MRKKVLIIFVALLIFGNFFGCKADYGEEISQNPQAMESASDVPTVRLCLDFFEDISSNDIQSFLDQVIGRNNKALQIEYEIAPRPAFGEESANAERDNYLTYLRTELMAGKGPDVFICSAFSPGGGQGIFLYPRQAMNNHLFLPLDSYLAKAQYMEMDKLLPQVMEAGKNQEGWQLLPVTYEFRMRAYDKAQYQLDLDLPMTWSQMLESGDPALLSAAGSGFFCDIFGELGDYDRDVPAMSEEELLARAEEKLRAEEPRPSQGDTVYMTAGWMEYIDESGTAVDFSLGENEAAGEYTLIPAYNISGGVTANVCTFAAINRNTQCPDEAFMVLDYLLSKDCQSRDPIYSCMAGLSLHQEAGSKECPIQGKYMSEENFQEFSRVRDQINAVKFYTPLDETVSGCLHQAGESGDLEAKVHSQYMKLKMMLAES